MEDIKDERTDVLEKVVKLLKSNKGPKPEKQIKFVKYFLEKGIKPTGSTSLNISGYINKPDKEPGDKSLSVRRHAEKVNEQIFESDVLWDKIYFETNIGRARKIAPVFDRKAILELNWPIFERRIKEELSQTRKIELLERQKVYDEYGMPGIPEESVAASKGRELAQAVRQDVIEAKIGKYIDAVISQCAGYNEDKYIPSEAIDRNYLNDIDVERHPDRIHELSKAIDDDNGKCVSVIESLQKYSNGHVLLIGDPCFGKTSALYKLLLMKATDAKNGQTEKIPVLLSLQCFDSSIESLIIKAFYGFSKIKISEGEVSLLINRGRLFYLFDGINETPAGSDIEALKRFASENIDAPMVFTTRPYSKGGGLEIKQRLEMLPLSDRQISEYSKRSNPDNYREFFFRLRESGRILSKNPYFFKMILGVFEGTKGDLPIDAIGNGIQEYIDIYVNHFKGDIKVHYDKNRWSEFSKNIAFYMIEQGKGRDSFLDEMAAIDLISNIRKRDEPDPKTILNDLIDHYMVVRHPGENIGFFNRVITDYFAGKFLLEYLPALSGATIRNRFLNDPKWTDPIIFMLRCSNDEELKDRICKLAKDIDKSLYDRLTDEDKFQADKFISKNLLLKWDYGYRKSFASFRVRKRKPGLERPSPFDTYWALMSMSIRDTILDIDSLNNLIISSIETDEFVPLFIDQLIPVIGDIGNDKVADHLKSILPTASPKTICLAAKALGQIESKEPSEYLIGSLIDDKQDENRKKNVIGALALLKDTGAVQHLIRLLSNRRTSITILHSSIKALGIIGDKWAVDPLLRLLSHKNSYIRMRAIEALGLLEDRRAIEPLSRLIENEDIEIKIKTVAALGRIRKNISIETLKPFIGNKSIIVLSELADMLGEIKTHKAAKCLVELLSIRPDNFFVINKIIAALGKTGDNIANDALSKYLNLKERRLKHLMTIMNTLSALVNIGDRKAIHLIQPLMNTEDDPLICLSAAEALFMLGERIDDTIIISLLDYRHSGIFSYALYLLKKIGGENTILKINNLNDMARYHSLGLDDVLFSLQSKFGIYNPSLQ